MTDDVTDDRVRLAVTPVEDFTRRRVPQFEPPLAGQWRWADIRDEMDLRALPVNSGAITLAEPPEFDTVLLPVQTIAVHHGMTGEMLEDEPRLMATIQDAARWLADYAVENGMRYIEEPVFQVADATPWPTPIPDPWWRRPLVWLGLLETRYTEPRPEYVLRGEVRAA